MRTHLWKCHQVPKSVRQCGICQFSFHRNIKPQGLQNKQHCRPSVLLPQIWRSPCGKIFFAISVVSDLHVSSFSESVAKCGSLEFSHLVPGTFHPESGTWHFSPGIWHLVLCTWYLESDNLDLAAAAWVGSCFGSTWHSQWQLPTPAWLPAIGAALRAFCRRRLCITLCRGITRILLHWLCITWGASIMRRGLLCPCATVRTTAALS